MYREAPDGKIQTDRPHFRSITYSTVSQVDLDKHDVNEAFQKMSANLESYLWNASGWNIHTVVYKPVGGSSYIKLPMTLKQTHAILNIKKRPKMLHFVYISICLSM